jgi:hypothetical protein
MAAFEGGRIRGGANSATKALSFERSGSLVLVQEVAYAGEHHGHAQPIRGGNHLAIAH